MIKKVLFSLFFGGCLYFTFAQETQTNIISLTEKIQQNTNNKVRIYQDKQIDEILLENYKKSLKTRSYRGYRIQIFSGTSDLKIRASNARYRFNKRFPHIKSYIEYKAPTFRVKVGSYRTKLEAARAKHKIKKYFPDCYIVKDRIKFQLPTSKKQLVN